MCNSVDLNLFAGAPVPHPSRSLPPEASQRCEYAKTVCGLESHQRKRADRLQLEVDVLREQVAHLESMVAYSKVPEDQRMDFADWSRRKQQYDQTLQSKDAEIASLRHRIYDADPDPPESPGEEKVQWYVTGKRYRSQRRRNRELEIQLEDQRLHNWQLNNKLQEEINASWELANKFVETEEKRRQAAELHQQQAEQNRTQSAELASWQTYGRTVAEMYQVLAQWVTSQRENIKRDKQKVLATRVPLPTIDERELLDNPDASLRVHPWTRLTGSTGTRHRWLNTPSLRFIEPSAQHRIAKRSSKPARLIQTLDEDVDTSPEPEPMDLDGDQEMTDPRQPRCYTCGHALNDATAASIMARSPLLRYRRTSNKQMPIR